MREHGNPLQDSCLKNPMDRGAWWAVAEPWHRKELDSIEVTKHSTAQHSIRERDPGEVSNSLKWSKSPP